MDDQSHVVTTFHPPVTGSRLLRDFARLGLDEKMTLLVHASLRSLGWVCGGTQAVIESLMRIISAKGTLVMPTQSFDLSEPSYWKRPPVPQEWWPVIRQELPAYHRDKTPTRGMGAIAEAFRTFPGVVRSSHPHVSFAAWGKRKNEIIAWHPLDFPLDWDSPLGRLYQLDAHVLLLGVSYDSNTSFHLAEYGAKRHGIIYQGAPIIEDGCRVWKTYRDLDLAPAAQLLRLGEEFESACTVRVGTVGHATARLFKLKDAVDFAGQDIIQ